MLDCRKCGAYKEESSFSKKNNCKRGYSYICKECHNKYSREVWYKRNSKRQIGASRKWKKENKFRCLAVKYNTTEIVISKLFEKANNRCECCGIEGVSLNVDHCHETGIVRGLLCSNCNKALGFVSDNKNTLRNMIKYLCR